MTTAGEQAGIIQNSKDKTMKVFEDLQRRGLVKQVTDAGLVSQLLESDEPQTFYIGFDPTADSLHVGHLLQLITAKRLIGAGHKAIMLIGDGTAHIGDPSGKSSSRPMMDEDTIGNNALSIRDQIKKITGVATGQIVFNGDWLCNTNLMEFMRDVGAHFSINNMLRADCFKSRMAEGLTFLEFSYMLMQGFDFFELSRIHGCALQIGGDDQWSNMLAGIDLIHKKTGKKAFALTLPLLVNADGTKMGKTEKGAVWLDPNKTSPFDFFQFWRNIPDDKLHDCLLFFTSMTPEELLHLLPVNELKKKLAVDLTFLVHGEALASAALEQAEALFEKRDTSALETVPVAEGTHILDLLITCGFAKSRTDGRNLITNRGIAINDEVLTDPTTVLSALAFGKNPVVKKGKKNFCRLLIEAPCPDPKP